MANTGLEYQVISKIIELQDFQIVQKLKIDESFFFSAECRQLFQYLWNHYHARETFGQIPSWDIVRRIYTAFPFMPSSDPLETLCNQLRLAKMRLELLGAADQLTAIASHDPRKALSYVRQVAASMATRHEFNDDFLFSNAYEALLKEYHAIAGGHGLTGLPWPWDLLNEETQGIHKGEFILMYGRPKSMKTWIALVIAVYVNMHANARVLVCSFEMPPQQIIRRVAAIRTAVDYRAFKAGKLQSAEYYRAFNELYQIAQESKDPNLSDKHAPFMVCGPSGDGGGISFLHSKVREFKPDLVLVDGMYLMKDDRQKARTIDWKAIAHISQDLKTTAREFNVPIVGVSQANRKADKNPQNADLVEVAYSDALVQDCDLAIRVHKRKDKTSGQPEVVLALPGMREGDLDAFLINSIPAIDFTFKSAVVQKEEDDKSSHAPKNGVSNGHNNSPNTVPPINPSVNRKL